MKQMFCHCNFTRKTLIWFVPILFTVNVTNKIVFPSDDQSEDTETYSAAESKRLYNIVIIIYKTYKLKLFQK